MRTFQLTAPDVFYVQWGIGCRISCARYIFASLFCMSKREGLKNKGECFHFTLKALFILGIKKF